MIKIPLAPTQVAFILLTNVKGRLRQQTTFKPPTQCRLTIWSTQDLDYFSVLLCDTTGLKQLDWKLSNFDQIAQIIRQFL